MDSTKCIERKCPYFILGGGCGEGKCPVWAVVSCSCDNGEVR